MANRVESAQLAECMAALTIATDEQASLSIRITFYNKASDAFTALQDMVLSQLTSCREDLEELKKGEKNEEYS